ncbi:MAG: restriction endonuclease [Dehalococcoidia bacterium]|nr:restriction endonuclease [Dehalococcoidia bacterium]
MNKWIQKSIEIANAPGYLDSLSEVYPVTLEAKRVLSAEVKSQLKDAHDNRDGARLIRALLELDKFPIKDPYVAFLRRGGEFLDYNPETVDRIAETLFSMSFEEMIAGCEEPKEFNRQIGTLFRRWLPKLGYPFLPEQELDRYEGVALLAGSNGEKTDYANRVLGCNLSKGLDLLAKASGNYIIGEAKFLTDSGGHQNAQFEDALRLIRGEEGNAVRIAILDGVVWIRGNTKMFRTVNGMGEIALSALLLKDFLESQG